MLSAVGYNLKYKQGSKLPCFYFSKTDSTNARAKALIEDGKILSSAVVFAGRQTAGRGRYDRQFVSPRGGAYMTYVVKVAESSDYAFLGCAAAIAACDTLACFGFLGLPNGQGFPSSVTVKWPNDVRINGKKLVGILPESVVKNGERYVLVGVGLNVNTTEKQLGELAQTATSMRIEARGARFSLSYVSAILATATDRYATECLKSGNAEILAEYKARCDTLEKQISYTDASGNASCGRAIDVAADGSLIVDDGGKTDKIGWGEITEIK